MAKSLSTHITDFGRQLTNAGDALAFAIRDRLQVSLSLPITDERVVRRMAAKWLGVFWSVAMGVIAAGLPLALTTVLLSPEYIPVAAMASMVIVGLVTYAGDWKAGLAATGMSVLILSRWMTTDVDGRLVPVDPDERAILGFAVVGGLTLALLVERLKIEGSVDRQESLAARSAATALSAVETVAATQQDLNPQARLQLHEAIVRSVVGVNRAHAGALLITDAESGELAPAAVYGFGARAGSVLVADCEPGGFTARIRTERRTLQLSGLQRTSRYSHFRDVRVKSLLGSPIIGQNEQFLGILLVGLLVDHRFPSQEVRKLEALASQVASILETMAVMGRREIQLRQAQDEQRRLERLIVAIPEALIVTAPPSGAVIAMNTAAQRLFGDVPPEKLLERVRIADPDRDGTIAPSEAALTFGDVAEDIECVIEADDGREIPVLASAAPIHNEDSTIWAVVSAFRDISALKEASRLKDEFVSVVSHELRSPLTPIRGFVQLVARELSREGGHEVHVTRLESVSGHVDRLTRLVDDLLDVSRLRSGTLEIRTEPIDLVALCQRVIDAHSTQDTGHTILFGPAEPSIQGRWDPDRIHQVLDNLVLNAIKYGPDDSSVSLAVRREDGQAIIEVRDSGPGIDEHQRASIFGAFYRTPSAAAGQVQGLGLGLFICRELVEAHGGTIDVERPEAGGSVFIVRLPIEDGADDQQAEPAPSEPVLVFTPAESEPVSATG
jgi:PAS domain S-box-containing protein